MEPRKDQRTNRSNDDGQPRRKRSDKMHPCGDVVYTRLSDLQTKHGFSFVDVGESNQSPSTTKTAYLPLFLELWRDPGRSECCHGQRYYFNHCCWKITNLTINCSSHCSLIFHFFLGKSLSFQLFVHKYVVFLTFYNTYILESKHCQGKK